jgi:hypothetical protein
MYCYMGVIRCVYFFFRRAWLDSVRSPIRSPLKRIWTIRWCIWRTTRSTSSVRITNFLTMLREKIRVINEVSLLWWAFLGNRDVIQNWSWLRLKIWLSRPSSLYSQYYSIAIEAVSPTTTLTICPLKSWGRKFCGFFKSVFNINEVNMIISVLFLIWLFMWILKEFLWSEIWICIYSKKNIFKK